MKEERWLRHDEVGLERISNFLLRAAATIRVSSAVEVREGQSAIGKDLGVSGFIVPDLEVHGFAGANAQENAENFQVGDFLREGRVETGAALLDKTKMETGGVGDGLKVSGDVAALIQNEVIVAFRNSGVLSLGEIGDGVLESAAEIGVLVVAAVASPPTGIDGELLEVGQTAILRNTAYAAGRKNGK